MEVRTPLRPLAPGPRAWGVLEPCGEARASEGIGRVRPKGWPCDDAKGVSEKGVLGPRFRTCWSPAPTRAPPAAGTQLAAGASP
eukprot:1423801-Alexandrium_andersonii.AAC.1